VGSLLVFGGETKEAAMLSVLLGNVGSKKRCPWSPKNDQSRSSRTLKNHHK